MTRVLFPRPIKGASRMISARLGPVVVVLFSGGSLFAQVPWEPAQDPLAGSAVFESKACVKCHAVNGLGGHEGPDLGRIPARRSFHELAATLSNHLPLMVDAMERYGVAEARMSPREASDLIGFLFTLDYFDPPGDVMVGKRLFTEKKCFVCHRVGSYGGDVGPSLDVAGRYGSPILIAAAMWNHSPTMADSMAARGVTRPTFDESELVDLIAYLESVAPQPVEGRVYVLPGRAHAGRVIFVEKRCVECHSVQGMGGRIGPDLARRQRHWGLTEFAAAMWNKAPAMQAAMADRGISIPKIGAVEMADLVAYLYSVEYFAQVGDGEMGATRLRDQGCLACHALQGQGGATAEDLAQLPALESPAHVVSALWNHLLVLEAEPPDAHRFWPRLSSEEIADIMAYFETPPAER